MKYISKYFSFTVVLALAIALSCNKKDKNQKDSDTIIEGSTSILVDETLLPIVEDQVSVFENQYNAKIKLIAESEKECVIDFTRDKAKIIVLPRELNPTEQSIFKQKQIVPRTTAFAIDALTFIKNKKSNDTLINLEEVLDFIKGKHNSIKGLVFDNPNSSTVRYLYELAKVNQLPANGVFSFKTNNEVIKYVSENEGMIGVVGVNWIFQPNKQSAKYLENINVLSVKSAKSSNYIYPSQENIANRSYPLARVLYIVNCQGYEGLGMGIASFIAGEIGQRIILTSGLAPMREPSRNIRIRNQIENVKK
jgi:phosphate transport system substrate-binding protein